MEIREKFCVYTVSNGLKPKKSILIIDDSLDLLILMRAILELDDYEILTAQSGNEAFKLLTEINRPDLIFLDVNMEGISGPEFLSMLEKKMPELIRQVPIVFLTGMDEVPKSIAVGFIRKPLPNIDTFLKTTRRFIELGTGNSVYEH